MSVRNKPTAGHRFAGIRYLFQARCECGWEGAKWIGKGGRGEAMKEWRWHIEIHNRESGQ